MLYGHISMVGQSLECNDHFIKGKLISSTEMDFLSIYTPKSQYKHLQMLLRSKPQMSAVSRCKVVTFFSAPYLKLWPVSFSNDACRKFAIMASKGLNDKTCEKLQLAGECAWTELQCVDENSRQLSGNTVSQIGLHIAHNTWPLHKNGWFASSWQAWHPSRSSVSCPILPS